MIPNRIERINTNIQKIVGLAIRDILEFPQDVLVTVTKVDTTKDFSFAYVYISILPPEKAGIILSKIYKHGKRIQSLLFKGMTIKKIPKLIFKEDSTAQNADKIEKLLKGLDKENK